MTRTTIAAVLLTALAGVTPAAAEGAEPPAPAAIKRTGKIPFRVVKLMPATQQALVFDRAASEHLVVQVGDELGAFQVIDIDDEELVLWSDGREVVLTVDPSAPAPLAVLAHRPPTVVSAQAAAPGAVGPTATPVTVATTSAPVATVSAAAVPAPAGQAPLDPYALAYLPSSSTLVAPVDPYAAAAPASSTPVDPYAADAAPVDPTAPAAPAALRTVMAPPAQRASLASAEVLDPYAEPTVVAAPAGSRPLQGVPAPTADAALATEIRVGVLPIQRAQLEAAVTRFDTLVKDHGFEQTARGVRLLRVAPGSYAHGLGLRGGDVVTAIDGVPLRGLDDVASAYVRVATANELRLDIERGSTRGTLRFALR